MFERALIGGRRYWSWLAMLAAVMAAGGYGYSRQLAEGLAVTGLSRDVTWGLYIAQFTFLVGVAASAVTVVLPYYLHGDRVLSKAAILGELLAIASVVMCGSFILADMGQPARILNVLLYPSPSSMMFWDMLSLGGYLALNVAITLATIGAERKRVPPPRWLLPAVVVSVPWAISIHTVTAFLYNGLPGRSFWLTAILAPRFLASAFASGPALLILLTMLLRRVAGYDVGAGAFRRLGLIVAYAMAANAFFLGAEIFTVLYSGIPEHVDHFAYLFVGLDGRHGLVMWTWTSLVLAVASLVILLVPRLRSDERWLAWAAALVIASLWIDKGLGLIVGGLVPSPLGAVTEYAPTAIEVTVTAGIWALGAFVLTVLYKITLSVVASRQPAPASVPGEPAWPGAATS